jgi:hypothetical protein
MKLTPEYFPSYRNSGSSIETVGKLMGEVVGFLTDNQQASGV